MGIDFEVSFRSRMPVMPSAELFLRLLEEKDLVSAEVLHALRREIQQSSLAPDPVPISLWLVEGHHITASQAQRLLAAVAEKTDTPAPTPPPSGGFRAKSSEPQGQTRQAGKPDVRDLQPKPPEPRRPADDLELAPLAEDKEAKSATTKPAKPGAGPQDSDAAGQGKRTPFRRWRPGDPPPKNFQKASPGPAATGQGEKDHARAKIGANWNRCKIR